VATCNTVGQTAGYFVGNVVFLTLESADFCNKYINSQHEDQGLITLAGRLFMLVYDIIGFYFCCIAMILCKGIPLFSLPLNYHQIMDRKIA